MAVLVEPVEVPPRTKSLRARTRSPPSSKRPKELHHSPRRITSSERMRQRQSSRPGSGGVVEVGGVAEGGGPTGRQGRQFTVGNVGTKGKIYLRYAHHEDQKHQSRWVSPSYGTWLLSRKLADVNLCTCI